MIENNGLDEIDKDIIKVLQSMPLSTVLRILKRMVT